MSPKSRPRSASSAAELRLFRREPACGVLGPGTRAVLWVQGCPLACPGCVVPEAWPRGGRATPVEEVAAWLLPLPVEGLTLTGGEPLEQDAALARLIDLVRAERDLGVVLYTGYRYEELRSPLLERVDLLIDGPYRRELHGDLLWRGSSNQRLLPLTPRYRLDLPDRGAGLEFRFGADGRFTFAGVPPWPDYREALP